MKKIPVKDQPGLYRDEKSGAIINCSDIEYNNYMEAKRLKSDVEDLKDMLKLVLNKLDK